MQTEPVISISKLGLTIKGNAILRDISLQVKKGDYLAIIGPNGAGKTSLLKCLMRIHSQFDGVVEINNHSTHMLSQRKLAMWMSYVPQLNGTTFPFTVEEFVLMGRYPYFNPLTAIDARDAHAVHDAMHHVDVVHLAQRPMMTLSGGERQLVLIAAALAQGAEILLLDEPSTYLDPQHKAKLYQTLRQLNETLHLTILIVTHDLNQAAIHSNRMVAMKQGTIVMDGTAQSIIQQEALQQVFNYSFTFVKHPSNGQFIILPEN
jgi:iron complex transport system ATP-binding protein